MFGPILRVTSRPQRAAGASSRTTREPVRDRNERYRNVLNTVKSLDSKIAEFMERKDLDSLKKIVYEKDTERAKMAIIVIAALASIDRNAFEVLNAMGSDDGLDSELKQMAASLKTSVENIDTEDPYDGIERAGFDSKKIAPRTVDIGDISPFILRRIG